MAKRTMTFVLAASAILCAGCWPWHRETPQQQFIEALNRGNAAQANQIWLNMDADDRAAFERGQGMTPDFSVGEAQRQILKHEIDKASAGQAPGGETIEDVTPHIGEGGLQSLPEYLGPPDGSRSAVTAPTN